MLLATWNVNGLRARFDFFLHWLRARRPDVLGLQELKLEGEQFPYDELRAEGYEAVVHGQKAWNGVAILSKKPITTVTLGLPGQDEMGARLVTGDVDGVRFTSVYVPNGKTIDHVAFPQKLAWLDALAVHLRADHDPSTPHVVGGDFNLCPTALDSWNEKALAGKIFHTVAERDRFRALVEWGLVDVFRERHPDQKTFSWWDYRGGAFHRGMGLRIDFLLATKPALERVESIEIDRDYRKKKDGHTPSDHAPVMMTLRP
jgi:exodeoxyribonuclease-3